MTNVEQADCRPSFTTLNVGSALQPSMVTLVQPKFMEHPHKNVRLAIASCLNEIIRITSTIAYNDVVLKKVLQLIVMNLKGLQVKGIPMRQEQSCSTCEEGH